MLKYISKSVVLGLIAVAVAVLPTQLRAQHENPIGEKKEAKPSKPAVTPFHGKLKAVDKTARTVSVGELTIQVTSETRLLKDGKPATLEDGVIDETVAGAYRKTEEGKLNATMIRFGAKTDKE
jgi:hypothetical protein